MTTATISPAPDFVIGPDDRGHHIYPDVDIHESGNDASALQTSSKHGAKSTPHTKAILRHKWAVWLYTSEGRPGYSADVPVRKATIVGSRRHAKRLAMRHAKQQAGNVGVWTRWSHNVRGGGADSPYVHFTDLVTTYHEHSKETVRRLSGLEPIEFFWQMQNAFGRNRYARAVANPRILGERHAGVYRSLTLWRAEDYSVEVTAGYFWTQEEAKSFGNQKLSLVLDGTSLQLRDATGKAIEVESAGGEWLDRIDDDDVRVTRLKAESRGKLMTEDSDFEPVDIPISDFCLHPELRSLGSLAYGVVEAASLHGNRSGFLPPGPTL